MRWMVLAVTAVVLLLEGRFRLEDYQARREFHYVPLHFLPGTMRLFGSGTRVVLAVNGRPVAGTSDYWQELSRYESKENRGPFRATVRGADGNVTEVEHYFANCTCGKMSHMEQLWYAMLPPALMIFAGLLGVWLWPGRGAAWVLLALALGAAQMSLVPDGFGDFRETAETRAWADGMRVPFLVYRSFFAASWPGWALWLAGLGGRAAAPWLGLGLLRMVMVVGWAENAGATAGLWEWQARYATELLIGAMAISVLSLRGWRRWAGAGLFGLALGLLYWPAEGLAGYVWYHYSDGSDRPEALSPWFWRMPGVIAAGYVAGLCVLGRRGWKVALWCVPLVAVAVLEVYWLSFDEYGVDAVLAAGYLGLLASVWGLKMLPQLSEVVQDNQPRRGFWLG